MSITAMKRLEQIKQKMKPTLEREKATEKVFFLKEGMIKVAGGFVQGALLSSLMGWTKHWLKTDSEVFKLIEDAAHKGDIATMDRLDKQIRHGWFWKSFTEMSKEMLGEISKSTAERYVQKFIEKGYIEVRPAEDKAIYRANWYRANIDKIEEDIKEYNKRMGKEDETVDNPTCPQVASQDGKCDITEEIDQKTEKSQENCTSQKRKPSPQTGKHLLSFHSFTSFKDYIYKWIRSENSEKLIEKMARDHNKNLESCLQILYLQINGMEVDFDYLKLVIEREITRDNEFSFYNWVNADNKKSAL